MRDSASVDAPSSDKKEDTPSLDSDKKEENQVEEPDKKKRKVEETEKEEKTKTVETIIISDDEKEVTTIDNKQNDIIMISDLNVPGKQKTDEILPKWTNPDFGFIFDKFSFFHSIRIL